MQKFKIFCFVLAFCTCSSSMLAQRTLEECSGICDPITIGDGHSLLYYWEYLVTDTGVSYSFDDLLDLPQNPPYPNVEEFCIQGNNTLCPSARLQITVYINNVQTNIWSHVYNCNGAGLFHFSFDAAERDIVQVYAQVVSNPIWHPCTCKTLGTADIEICHD